jgi:tetratricopeptide (TPR) repeat protein
MYSAGRNNALLYFLGESRYAMKNYQGAADAYLKTVEMKWPFQPAHYMLASSYVHLREFDKAAEVLSNSLAYQPVYPATYSLLSSLEFLRKDTNAARMHAEVYVREARKSGESSGTIFATLGRDCSSTDAYTNAISYYTKAIAYEPKTSQHHLEYASALYHLGSIDSAQSEFQETLRLDSALFEAHRMLAKISDRKNDSLTALGHYCAYLRYDSTSVEAKEIQVRVDEIRGMNNNQTH